MAQTEPMEVDCIGNEFDDKENSIQNSNVLPRTPCTEKGYEELDVSELNMKLRYSITPASSPMSRSYTANCKDNKTFNLDEDSFNNTLLNENNLTRSLNSTITKSDVTKSPKIPLQALSTDQFVDNMSSMQRSLDPNITITVNGTYNLDENLSIPSTSSSAVQTPEATTPTKDIPKDGGSPIMRGLKSVLNMFRSSQSPIPPEDTSPQKDITEINTEEQSSESVLASTPKAIAKNKDNSSAKRTSPLKDSVVFKEDLERELQWKDDSTIIFKQEKIPIHKLFLQQSTSLALEKKLQSGDDNFNSTVEYMDVSMNESAIADKTMTDIESKICTNTESTSGVESEGEFLDCETTYAKHEQNSEQLNSTLSATTNELAKEPVKQLPEKIVTDIPNFIENNPNTFDIKELSVRHEETESNVSDSCPNTDLVEKTMEQLQEEDIKNTIGSINLAVDLYDTVEIMGNNDTKLNYFNDSEAALVNRNSIDNKHSPVLHNTCQENKSFNTLDFVESKVLHGEEKLNDVQSDSKITVSESIQGEHTSLHLLDSIVNTEIDHEVKENNLISNNETMILEKNQVENESLNTSEYIEKNGLNVEGKPSSKMTSNNESNIVENVQEEKKSFSMMACEAKEVEEEKANNVTMPLNIETNNDSGNVSTLQKSTSGILQICMSDSQNYSNSILNNGHEHINIIEQNKAADLQCAAINYESKDVSIENGKDLKNEVLVNNDHNITSPYPSLTLDTEVSKDIVKHEVLNYENHINFNETVKLGLDVANDIQNNVIKTLDTESKVLEIKDIEYSTKLQEFSLGNSPADVPLPNDEDNEKDSLTAVTCFLPIDSKTDEKENTVSFDSGNKSLNLLDVESSASDTKIVDEISNLTEVPDIQSSKNISIGSTLLQKEIPDSEMKISEESLSICSNDQIIKKETSDIVANDIDLQKPTVTSLSESNIILADKKSETDVINTSQKILPDFTDVTEMEIDTPVIDKFEAQNIAEPSEYDTHILSDVVELKEDKIYEEIVTSTDTSPFVSVNELNLPKTDVELDHIENPFETKCKIVTSPPISPKMNRKGYNINFDEIDDPFATKTNIRLSPDPETSQRRLNETINLSQKKTDVQKKTQQNRRKSQPERTKRDITKKRFNSSYSVGTKIKTGETKTINESNAIKLQDTTTLPVTETDNLVDNINKLDTNLNTTDNSFTECENSKQNEIINSNLPTVGNNSDNNQNLLPTCNSNEEFIAKNVFNLPEIDDHNFNPFATKSKMRKTPSPTFDQQTINEMNTVNSTTSNEISENPQLANPTINCHENDKNPCQDNVELSNISNETCSSKNTEKDLTVREVNTEDEDTVEGPFLEAEDLGDVVKVEDFGSDTDMMHFEDIPTNIDNDNGNNEEGELFIDAEAFEFLLNQNKSNIVADSGKESLFLKFDPLFAKRVSSDGVLAALNRLQKRQSTPKKPPTPAPRSFIEEDKQNLNLSNVDSRNQIVPEENSDETNVTLSKPMMVVNPAMSSLVSPRKSTTPPRINRRSLTFTSPAMAVIDRLLSLSGNNCTLDHETTLPRPSREYNETDIALTQLRELLAEKEIHVHNLRLESKDLKDRLATMESQVKTLEKESEERLKKVNDLNECLSEKTKINKSMAVVVEEYERTIASLIAEMEQEKRRNAEERSRIISERDEQTAHLSSMEVSFSDLHSKYEKSKQIILSMKANEDTYKKSIKEFEDNLVKMQNNYELLKQHATSKLNHANQELEKFNRAHESEVLKLNAMIKRKELHITSLEESLAQKTKANEELTSICDELINKVG